MIIELMLLLIVLGVGILVVAWSNTRRRKQDALERREVEDSTGKLKQELERTANEIIGRMENHVNHLENVLDESERNRMQLEGRVTELKKLLKKSEGQSGEIRDLLARLDDAGAEVDSMQRKMDVVERKLNLAINTPIQFQQPVTIPPITPSLVQPIITPPINPAPIPPKNIVPPAQMTTPINVVPDKPPPPVEPPKPIAPKPAPTITQITTSPAEKINPLGPITVTPIIRPASNDSEFDKILENSIAEQPKQEKIPRSSIVLSPENKTPVKVVEADPVKIEATRRRLTEASAELAKLPPEESAEEVQAQPPPRKRRSKRDVRKAALDAIRAAEKSNKTEAKPAVEEPRVKAPPKKTPPLPERRDLKLETTDASIIKEMLLSGMSIEDIARETGLGRGAIELIQEMTRRQLDRR